MDEEESGQLDKITEPLDTGEELLVWEGRSFFMVRLIEDMQPAWGASPWPPPFSPVPARCFLGERTNSYPQSQKKRSFVSPTFILPGL